MFNALDKRQASQLSREIQLLTSFQCETLVSFKGAFLDEGCIGVILEYMDRGSLEFLTQEHIEVNEHVMAAISFQICWGLGYLHYENRMHRDIKPANILLNSRGQVKLSDFGISRELDDAVGMSNTSIGTFRYMSPERLRGVEYSTPADIWAMGISLIEVRNKRFPLAHQTPIKLLGELEGISFSKLLRQLEQQRKERVVAAIKANRSPTTSSKVEYEEASADMLEFLLCTLVKQPEKRFSTVELLSLPWLPNCGINDLDDAQKAVARWLKKLDRFGTTVGVDAESVSSIPSSISSEERKGSSTSSEEKKKLSRSAPAGTSTGAAAAGAGTGTGDPTGATGAATAVTRTTGTTTAGTTGTSAASAEN
mmetsp:Transcript_2664/g.4136  ORF Transcript_2664/g.4136 Transcript_2664/m.4136 type:complete len:367 (+) Transcript_2664:433-1533(+)